MESLRQKLMAVAREYADRLAPEPDVVGMALYGSLASGEPPELTHLSDVDIALILDRELPAHFTEHRLVNGVKVDVLLFSLDTVRGLVREPPQSLYGGGWVLHFLIKSFLLGGAEAILFDPTGEIARVKRALNSGAAYRALAVPDARRWTEEFARAYLVPAAQHLGREEWSDALNKAGAALWLLDPALQMLAAAKTPEKVARRLGVARFYEIAAELRKQAGPDADAYDSFAQAAQALWAGTRPRVFEPIRERLLRAGVPDPDRLELAGDHALFWAGNRIHEFGRVIAEVDLSFVWSREKQEQGDLFGAQQMLWACDAERTRKRCEGLAAALDAMGYNVYDIVTEGLEDVEFHRLAAAVDERQRSLYQRMVSPEQARQGVDLARELYAIATDVVSRERDL